MQKEPHGTKNEHTFHESTGHREIYARLFARFGDLHWWPGDTPDEILIGAVLTQNTSWKNVEKSMIQLKARGLLSIERLASTDEVVLQGVIRSSGFFRQKSRYLIGIASAIVNGYDTLNSMQMRPTRELEVFLAPLPGIGRETMDSILLYALDKRVFVIDAYTLRILGRLDRQRIHLPDEIRSDVLRSRSFTVKSLKNYHAMLVELGKRYCRKNPLCGDCPLNQVCDYAIDLSSP